MEFGLREMLILVGVVIVAGILLDGYRRMRKARQGIRYSSRDYIGGSAANETDDEWDMYRSELPNGGARVSGGARRVSPEPALDEGFGAAADNALVDMDGMSGLGALGDESPLDKEPLENRAVGAAANSNDDLFADDDLLVAARAEQQARLERATRGKGKSKDRDHRDKGKDKARGKPKKHEQEKPAVATTAPAQREPVREEPQEPSLPAPDFAEVIVLNVMSRRGEFGGAELQKVLASSGLHHGDMKIFHRYEQHNGKGQRLFSVANVVEPGFFDPDHIERLRTPGVCMFMQLPGPRRPLQAFDIMMDCARKVASMLDAEIRDEHHNPMRQQTAEHCRQRVVDFERKLLAYQAGQRQH